jgi:Uma2 family endonuclease
MSYDEWLALPEKPKAEWVDGVAVIYMAPPLYDHGRAQSRLVVALSLALPDLDVVTEVEVVLPRNRIRRPDIAVVDHPPADRGWIRDPAVLVVEVLSPSTQSEDLMRKAPEYAEARIGQYWTLSPEQRRLEVSELRDGRWEVVGVLDERERELTVAVGDHGTVSLAYDAIFLD